ncbi:MAG: DNA polymerase III subunit gamma/tau [Candidatus Neomarinimicrobiota bacterium]
MTYRVLALKWRPQSFGDVVGQNHVTQTLSNAFEQNRIGQGYIFTGPRGVGKTTTARILAMAMNAENGPSVNFNPKSNISQEIANSQSIDVLEIDGASNRGIEEIRSLREQIKFPPMNCNYKIIIIDEVHMLTNQAFNALLRTLEEPPTHVKFIFATTDIHKIPQTIISRCQRFDFNRISLKDIKNRLEYVLDEEKIKYDLDSINAISKKADGSMRDALSILEQVIAFCGNKIEYDLLVESIGIIPNNLYFNFTNSIRKKKYTLMLKTLNEFSNYGVPASEIINGFCAHIRNLIYAGVKQANIILEMNDELLKEYKVEEKKWDNRDLLRINQILIEASPDIRKSNSPYLLLEMILIRLLEMDSSIHIEELLSNYPNMDEGLGKSIGSKNHLKNSIPTQIINDETKSFKTDYDNQKKNSFNVRIEEKKPNRVNDKNPIIKNKISDKNLDFSIDKIVKLWVDIIREININRPSIGSIIEECKPIELKNEILVLKYLPNTGFNESLFNRAIPFVQEIIFKHFGRKLKLDIIKEKEQINSTEKLNSKNNQNNEEIFNKIIDVFDGEIIR